MKIKDLFTLNKDYSKISYIAGKGGEENEVLDIDILEVPDGMYWVEKGDFIVTMGYFFTTSPVKFENFIRILIQNKVAGLGVKLGRFFDTIPENALKLAEENNFPIINFPLSMRYKEITRPVIQMLTSEIYYKYEILAEYKKGLMTLWQNEYYVREFLDHAKKYVPGEMYLINKSATAFIYKTSQKYSKEILKCLEKNQYIIHTNFKNEVFKDGDMTFFTVGTSQNLLGYLCVRENSRQLNEVDITILKDTILYIVVSMYAKKPLIDNKQQNIEYFFDKIFDGAYIKDEQKLIAEAKSLNIDLIAYRFCIGLDISIYTSEIIEDIENVFKRFFLIYSLENIIYIKNDILYCIVSIKKDYGKKERSRQLEILLREMEFVCNRDKLQLNVSQVCRKISKIYTLMEEVTFLCKRAVDSEIKIAFYEDYMLSNILEEIQEHSSINNIINIYMEKLEEISEREKNEILKTLTVLSNNDFNLTKSSEALFLHRNSLYKRIKKIELLLDINLESSSDKFIISLFIRTINYIG